MNEASRHLTDQLVDNAVNRVGPTATVTVVTGPIAFVALAAPQVARRLTRSGAVDLPTSALVAATMLTLSDLGALQRVPTDRDPGGAVTVCPAASTWCGCWRGRRATAEQRAAWSAQPGGAQGQVALLG